MSTGGVPGPRPNVLLILTDDQGPWAAGCYGNPEIRTPNIDQLAAEGVRFDRFFVATPVCSPSRATLLTGLMPSQHGIHDWLWDAPSRPHRRNYQTGPDARSLTAGEVAYTDMLAAHGYDCGITGKWHLGDSLRSQHSFDFWYVHQKGGGPYHSAPMVRDGKPVVEPGYITDVITDEALRFLDQHRASHTAAPFYLSVHYTAPHSPYTGHPPELVASYDDCPFYSCPQEPRHPWALPETDQSLGNRTHLQGYFAAVTAMDANVGRLLRRLDELDLRRQTLVTFLSDNGFSCGHHGFWGKGNGTHPRNMLENSIRVPAIFSQPGRVPSGVATDAMVSMYDVFPTLLDYLGLPLPAGRPLPGKSFAPLLGGISDTNQEFIVVYDEHGPVRMIRTREWKYVHRYPDGPHDLFDLVNDPDEGRNLIGDPARASLVHQLRTLLEEWFDQHTDPMHDGRLEPGREA